MAILATKWKTIGQVIEKWPGHDVVPIPVPPLRKWHPVSSNGTDIVPPIYKNVYDHADEESSNRYPGIQIVIAR